MGQQQLKRYLDTFKLWAMEQSPRYDTTFSLQEKSVSNNEQAFFPSSYDNLLTTTYPNACYRNKCENSYEQQKYYLSFIYLSTYYEYAL